MSMPAFQRDIVRSCVWSSRGKVLGFFAATLCAAGSSVGGPFVLARAIPQVGVVSWQHLIGYFLVFAAALGAVRVLQELKLVLTNSIEQDVRDMTNKRTLRGLLAVSESVYREVNSGKVATLLAGLHQSNKMCVQTYLMVLVGGMAEIIVSLAVIGGFASWYVAVFVPVYGVVIVWITLRSNKVTAAVLREASSATNEGANLLGNIISNIESIKVFRGQSWVAGLYGRYSESARSRWNVFYRTRLRYGLLQALTVFLQFTAIFGMLLWSRAGVEQFVLVGLVLLQLNRPFELIGTSLRDLALARGMAEPMAELLHDHTVVIDGERPGRSMPSGAALTVSVRGLSYTYPGASDPALRPLDADFRPGPVNYVVGPSGAGKSTLMRIVLGLLRDYSGSVTVGGVELVDIDLDDLFTGVGYVPQHPVMMNLSIRDNIVMGRNFTDDQVQDVLAEVQLTAKLADVPDGLDHLIGERGEKLSGGERQRLAIARALIARPKILLLDEASSALDAATERAIFQTLASVSRETTIIAITHRENLINDHDAVIRIGAQQEPRDPAPTSSRSASATC